MTSESSSTADVAQEVNKAYETGAGAYSTAWIDVHPWLEEERKLFAELLPKGSSILDVGCGPGRDSAYWLAKGMKTHGIDVSAEMIRIAREQYPELRFTLLDVKDACGLDERYDGVWMSYVLLHIPSSTWASLFEGIGNILATRGICFVSTAVCAEPEIGKSTVAGLVDKDGREILVPTFRMTASDVLQAIQMGFETLWTKTTEPLPGKGSISIICRKKR